MEKTVKGAWIIHHGQKIRSDTQGAAEFSALDTAAKAGTLLAQLVRAEDTVLDNTKVAAYAAASGLNVRIELTPLLDILQSQKLIDRSTGQVAVVGGTAMGALTAAADVFISSEPTQEEEAAISVSEMTSDAPCSSIEVAQKISDTFSFSKDRTSDFLLRSELVGFIDAEGESVDKLYFNGNLFREAGPIKVQKVLSTLDPTERTNLGAFLAELSTTGCIGLTKAEAQLGGSLIAKVRSIGLLDVSFVDNEIGSTGFVTKPDAFHKFVSPSVDDAFDLAKALVAALTYGMIRRTTSQGQIWGVSKLLSKLIDGALVGPATAIGHDYKYLEHRGVVEVIPNGRLFSMRLRKPEIGRIALQVLTQGAAVTAQLLEKVPDAPMAAFRGPAITRSALRKSDFGRLKRSDSDILQVLRTRGGLK